MQLRASCGLTASTPRLGLHSLMVYGLCQEPRTLKKPFLSHTTTFRSLDHFLCTRPPLRHLPLSEVTVRYDQRPKQQLKHKHPQVTR